MKIKVSVLAAVVPALLLSWAVAHPAFSASTPAPVPNAIISAASSWGTAADSWAGYTGSLSVWVPTTVSGGWTLTFQSAGLGRQIQVSTLWNGHASFDHATNTFVIGYTNRFITALGL